MRIPLNRRRFMHLAGSSVSALALPPLLAGCGDGEPDRGSSPDPSVSLQRTLHFALTNDGFLAEGERFQLLVAGTRYAMVPHDAASRGRYGASAATASHYAADVGLPASRAIHIYVTQRSDLAGDVRAAHGPAADHALVASAIHVPPVPPSGVAAKAVGDGSGALDASQIDSFTPADIACAIIFHHANLMALDAGMAAIVMGHIRQAPGISDLVAAIKAAGRAAWYDMQPVLGDDDVPQMRPDGSPLVQYIVKPQVMQQGQLALASALNAVHNDPALKDIFYSSAVATAATAKRAKADAQTSDGLTYTLTADGRQTGLTTRLQSVSGNQVTLNFQSRFIRHLSVFVEFLDADGNPVDVGAYHPASQWMSAAAAARLETPSRKFLSILTPPGIFLGGPIMPSEAVVSFSFPSNASAARILVGGIGNGGERNAAVEEMGVALTATFDIGVPSLLLAAAAGYHTGTKLSSIFDASMAATVVDLFFRMVWSQGDHSAAHVTKSAAVFLANIMMKKALGKVLALIVEEETESAALDAIPFVGWALNAVAIATTAAQLAQTSAEVASSPWIIQNRLSVTHTVVVQIDHDPQDFEFPATATHYVVRLTFSHADRMERRVDLPGTTVSARQVQTFTGVPAGGTVSVSVTFYAANDWVAGQVSVVGIRNQNLTGATELRIPVGLTENLVPLSAITTYSHKERLTATRGGFAWQGGAAPTGTVATLSSQAGPGALASLYSISVNQTLGRVSYAWQSDSGTVGACGSGATGGLGYAYRTTGLVADPNVGLMFSGCYAATPALVENALFTDPSGAGPNLLVQAAGADGSYAVTGFTLDASPPYAGAGVLGVFPIRPDVVRRCSDGRLVGISRAVQKIFVLPLAAPTTLDAAPQATLLCGPATSAASILHNPGLLLAPVTLAVGRNDAVIVLEIDPADANGAGQLRAFNTSGVPLGYFGAAGTDQALALRATAQRVTYLDMRIEDKGYIFVLSYAGNGDAPGDYRMDLYDPAGQFLAATTGMAAASFALDAWRNIYTLNYEALTSPLGDTQPSVSQWIPSTPAPT